MSGLDLEALSQEISPDLPSGENLEYDAAYISLGTKIQGTPEDPFTKEPAQPPNWKEVRKEALELLRRTHDLRLILYLVRALIHTDGFTGLRDGLALLDDTIRDFWPSVYPQLDPDDDNDPTPRVNIVMELCDFETMLRPIALIPLVESRTVGRFSLRDVQIATDKLPPSAGGAKPEVASIQAAFTDAGPDSNQTVYRAVAEGLSRLAAIETFVTDQVGAANAPNLQPVRALFKEARSALEQFGGRGAVPEETAGEAPGEEEQPEGRAAASAGTTAQLGAVNNRQDVVRALDLICEYYARVEPSSPVPIFLQRAKRLVTMSFMDIVKNLAPNALAELEILKGPDSDNPGS